MKQLKTVLMAMGVALICCANVSADVVLKIGYVDFQKIVESWPEAKKKMEDLETKYQEVQGSLDTMDEKIQKMKEDLDAQKAFMTEEQAAKKQEEYQMTVKNYLAKFKDERSALEEEKKATLEEVRLKVKAVVQDVAERNGYSLIMRKQDLVYAVDKYDITDEVISDLSKRK